MGMLSWIKLSWVKRSWMKCGRVKLRLVSCAGSDLIRFKLRRTKVCRVKLS